jgi:hypothetical protein
MEVSDLFRACFVKGSGRYGRRHSDEQTARTSYRQRRRAEGGRSSARNEGGGGDGEENSEAQIGVVFWILYSAVYAGT